MGLRGARGEARTPALLCCGRLGGGAEGAPASEPEEVLGTVEELSRCWGGSTQVWWDPRGRRRLPSWEVSTTWDPLRDCRITPGSGVSARTRLNPAITCGRGVSGAGLHVRSLQPRCRAPPPLARCRVADRVALLVLER